MIRSHHFSPFLIAALTPCIAFLSGCAASRPTSFVNSFLPATPVLETSDLNEPSHLASNPYLNSLPNLELKAKLKPVPSEADVRIRTAEARFEAGKKAYGGGDLGVARRYFDSAMESLLGAPETAPGHERVERKIDELVDAIFSLDRDGLGAGAVRDAVVFDKSPIDDGILTMTFPIDPKLRPKIKEEILATVSQLPLESNDIVDGYIQYFSTDRGRRTLVMGLKRAGRYRPLIQRILDEEGVPQELIYLAQAESGFLPRAVSNRQARGMWQFVSWRGKEYGLQQADGLDDRLDPEKATRAAARHLRDLYHTFGDWYLAMAAFNCGPGCVDRAVQRTGFADFWQLSRLNALPRETLHYVPLILALTIMSKNAKDYGLENLEVEQPVEYDTLTVDAPTNVDLVADAAGRPAAELRDLNPALLKPVAPTGYQLHIPKGASSTVLAALENVPPAHRSNWRIHRVETGETIAEIARRFSTSAETIAEANRYSVAGPETGDLLVIPATAVQSRVARASVHTRRGRAGTYAAVSARVLNRRAPVRALHTASLSRRHAGKG